MTRMIERWFPCAEVSANSESGWGSGNSEANLFTWFARRPLAQARAAVITSLLEWPDDPAEQTRLRELVRESMRSRDGAQEAVVREIVRHNPDGASIIDTFSGRAMIPLEAARLGVRSRGIDYSPVAALAGRLLAEYPLVDWTSEPPLPFPGYDQVAQQNVLEPRRRLERDVAFMLDLIATEVECSLDAFYPVVGGRRPWGYLWAYTLACTECRVSFPLVGNLELRLPKPGVGDPGQSFLIQWSADAGSADVVVHEGAPTGTPTLVSMKRTRGKSAVCPACFHVHPVSTHARLAAERRLGEQLLVVAEHDAKLGKVFRHPTDDEIASVDLAREALRNEAPFENGLSAVPSELIPPGNTHTIRPSKYGARSYGDLCNARQTLAFVHYARSIERTSKKLLDGGVSERYALALASYCGAVLVRKLRQSTRGARLQPTVGGAKVGDVFVNESTIGFAYDHFEAGTGQGPGTWRSLASNTVATLRSQVMRPGGRPALVSHGNALSVPLPAGSVTAVVTDPPYGSMIDYSDASDLFFVWLKRALSAADPFFSSTAHPSGLQEKDDEIIVKDSFGQTNDHRNPTSYEDKIAKAFAEAGRLIADDGVVTIVFGHGDPDVWHRLLTAIARAGLVLTASWPARTEKGGKAGSANIVTTLTLACRQAPRDRSPGRVADVDAEVRQVIARRVPRWDEAGLALTDQLMAAVGPAMEVVGRYSEILDKRGERVDLDRYLPLARRAVEEAAAIKIGSIPLEQFDDRTHFALFWVRVNGRSVTAGSEARWQRLASDLTEAQTAGLLASTEKGVRFAYADEHPVTLVEPTTPVIDVALALAGCGKSLAAVAQVLSNAERVHDEFLWAALSELSATLPDGDRDGETWTWLVRNRQAVTGVAGNVQAARQAEAVQQREANRQQSLFGGDGGAL